MKVYEIAFRVSNDPNEDMVIWVATDRKISLARTSDAKYLKEIDVPPSSGRIDIIIE